jgi:periplasmic protein TonB
MTEPVLAPTESGERDPRGAAAHRPRPPSRALTITLIVSLGLHVLAAAAVLLLLHPAAVPVALEPEQIADVELVMEERKGDPHPPSAPETPNPSREKQQAKDKASTPEQPADKAEDQQANAPTPSSEHEQPAKTPPIVQDASADPAAEAVPPPPAQKQEATQAEQKPAPAALRIELEGTDSPSDARAWGSHVIPAKQDAVFHNKPPEYPVDAAADGEQGTVVLLIHVAPSGRAAGVDVVRSSGYLSLDSAARDAVAKWRFLPAVKDGQPVPSEMTMGFVFAFN